MEWWDAEIEQRKISVQISESGDSISIMTIHRSKGLQFPIVIMPFTNWSLNPKGMLWVSPEEKPYKDLGIYPIDISATLEKTIFAKEYFIEKEQKVLEEITGQPVTGLRMPRMRPVSVEAIKNAGYYYDSSIHPTWLPGRYNNLDKPRTLYHENGLLRLPASVSPTFRIPLFWLSFKNLPFAFYKQLALQTLRKDGVLCLYYHPWEFTNLAPSGIPKYTRTIDGEMFTERLEKLIKVLKKEGDFIKTVDYVRGTEKKMQLRS